jgi:hypothetical protein
VSVIKEALVLAAQGATGMTEAVHYTEIRCGEDELARMWALYPWDG